MVGRGIGTQVRRRLDAWPRIHARYGEVIVSVPLRERPALVKALRGQRVRFLANVDRVMALPPAVDKGSGTRTALRQLRVAHGGYAALGDAENDLDLLHGAVLAAAVGNAEPRVRAAAEYVCRGRFDVGALEFVRGPLAAAMLAGRG